MPLFTELRHELEGYLDNDQVEQIYKAYLFAANAHQGQQRRSGDPYIVHPLAVAQLLGEMRMDAQTIVAAILHDVIEDTPTDKATIAKEFSNEVAELVDGVSKLTQAQFKTRAEAQAENFRKMLLAMAKDIRVIIIKLADRLHNMRTLGAMPPEKKQRIALETLDIYVPIASRLGMYAFRVEFEELIFAVLYPFRYRVLQEGVRKAKQARKHMMGQIETALKECLEKHLIPPSVVWARKKHLYSIYKDMREKHLSLTEIMDSYTFCIVVDSVDTCYRVLGAVHNLYIPIPERFRDFIALPKGNGYQALHTTLFGPEGMPIEIQIRTVDMDRMADNGVVTHWRFNYAEGTHNPAHLQAREWLKRLLDIQQVTVNSSLDFIEDVKIDLFPEEVYVFTPLGEIKALPKGATPVDFAYAIHSDLGDHCKAARIDRRPAALSTMLASGQVVEIDTEPSAHPNPGWLEFVVTGKARSGIRHFLKEQRRDEAITLGKQLLINALSTIGLSFNEIPTAQLKILLKQLDYKNSKELFTAIGLGDQLAPFVAQRFLQHPQANETLESKLEPLVIGSNENLLLTYADCCRPIPGDAIVGVTKAGQGLTIHATQCPRVVKLRKHSERFVPAKWDKNIQGNFKVDVRIEVYNKYGALAQIANTIAQAKANIDNMNVFERDKQCSVIRLTISVSNRVHLAHILRRLRNLKIVTRLARGK